MKIRIFSDYTVVEVFVRILIVEDDLPLLDAIATVSKLLHNKPSVRTADLTNRHCLQQSAPIYH